MSDRLNSQQRIGLGPGPWTREDDWPTYGYDSELRDWIWDDDDRERGFHRTGHSREEWIALADEMIARWTAYRAHLESLKPD